MPIDAHDIEGFGQLTGEAVVEISKLVEAAQKNVARLCGAFVPIAPASVTAITGLIHHTVRGMTRAVDSAVKSAARGARLANSCDAMSSSPLRETIVAAVNGVIGDHLAATGNPLAIRMSVRRNGRPLKLEKESLLASIPDAGSKLLVLVHGLCRNDLQWARQDLDYGSALARDLGYTPVYLHYNSGLHISENGQAFSDLLAALVRQWPAKVRELVILGHSAGGLVSRSACHYATAADQEWQRYLQHLIFVGTPHHGAPLERWGNLVNVGLELSLFSAPYSRIAKIRSAGITDLRYAYLRHEDWRGRDRFAHSPDVRAPLPLPHGVRCYAIAAVSGKRGGSRGKAGGDGIVPLDSALGRHPNPAMALQFAEPRQWIGYEMNHWDLLCHPAVYERIRRWLQKSG